MKKITSNYGKEVIKSRIMKNATKLWGVSNPHALDPFVTLLIDAFSTEIFKVNNDIEQIKGGILEKIARLLTPSMYTSSKPAHAIAVIEPEESQQVLFDHQEFFMKKTFTSNVKATSDFKLDIPFTAIDNINLIKAKVSYTLIGDTLWEYDAFYNRVPIAKVKQDIAANQLFLAIDLSAYEREDTPVCFSLYCDNPTFDHLEFVYNLLPFIEMTVKDDPLEVTAGLSFPAKKNKTGFEAVFDDYAIERRIQENVKTSYASKFIELKGFKRKVEDLKLEILPQEIAFLMEENPTATHLQNKRLLWVKMEFPPPYTKEIMEGFSFYLNAFPVYNRGWRCNESSLDIMGNTIPLVTKVGEDFLYTHQVVDSHMRVYNEIPFAEESSLMQGLFTIRKGGMERFSERNAIDMISYVIELTRDEVSAFGILERDKVIEALQKMVYQMQTLNQKIKTVNDHVANEVQYVIVEPLPDTEVVKASYWITHCALANNIRKGAQLTQQDKVYENVNKHIVLLSTTKGGEQEKKGTDAIQAYKYALTTRDTIISKEDIKNYCILALQGHCKAVHISNGVQVSEKPKEGFTRTINIEITVDNYEFGSRQYWIDYARNFKKQLTHRAIDGIVYIVEFKGENSTE